MSGFSKEVVRSRLAQLSPSQESVETLTMWMIHHHAHAKECTDEWLRACMEGAWAVPEGQWRRRKGPEEGRKEERRALARSLFLPRASEGRAVR